MSISISQEIDLINMISHDKNRITGYQLRAARSLLGISAQELAARAGIGVATVRRAEAIDGEISMTSANEKAILEALSRSFVKLHNNGEVRLTHMHRIYVDGKPNSDFKYISDIEKAKRYAQEFADKNPHREITIESSPTGEGGPVRFLRFDRDVDQWVPSM